MPQLDNPRHERFCQLVAKGASYQAAYGEVYNKSGKSAGNMGSRLLEDAGIKDRITELQAEGASATVITIVAAHEFLNELLECKIGEVDETSRLCQSYKITPELREFKVGCKLRAIELSMKLQGYLRDKEQQAPTVNVNITLPRALMEAIQEKRKQSLIAAASRSN